MDESFISTAVKMLVPMILSLTLHEYAHALMAQRLGDNTAREQGRMTLDPLSHIDPIGTLLLPLSLLFLFGGNGPSFGWAKPVPYNPTRFSRKIRMRTGAMLVAAAGPAANILAAFAFVIGLGLLIRFGIVASLPESIKDIIVRIIGINVGLAIFNLVPVPPLDGAKVLVGVLPAKQAQMYEEVAQRFGLILFALLIFFGGRLLMAPMMVAFNFLVGVVLPSVAGA